MSRPSSCLRTKRKSDQGDDDIPVEWVDDVEWKAIEASFEAIPTTTAAPIPPCEEDLKPPIPLASLLPPPNPLPPNSTSSSMIPLNFTPAAPSAPSTGPIAAVAVLATASAPPAIQNFSKLCRGCHAAAALPTEIPVRCWCGGGNRTIRGGGGGTADARGDGEWVGNGGWEGGLRSCGDYSGLRTLPGTGGRRRSRNSPTSDRLCWAPSAAEQNHSELHYQANGVHKHGARELEEDSGPAEAPNPSPEQNSVTPGARPEELSDNGAERDDNENFSPQVFGIETDVNTGERAVDSAAAVEEEPGARRQLPAWMQASREIGKHPSGNTSRRSLSSGDCMGNIGPAAADQDAVEERPTSRLEKEDERVQESSASIAQQQQGTIGGPPGPIADACVDHQPLEQPQGLPWGIQPDSYADKAKPKFPAMQFRGQIVYSKTESEVNVATLELWHRVRELQETTQGVVPIGFDLEWKASFERGVIPRKVAVMQLCLDGRRCDVMHIFYSGIPLPLQSLLEAPSTLKVGLGIHGDASKLHQDYQIRTEKVADLRVLAREKMRTLKQWSLSSLALELTGREIEKVQSIRCGDWEALPLSEPQLQYAATDAFASLHLYQVLASFPTPGVNGNKSDGDSGTTAVG